MTSATHAQVQFLGSDSAMYNAMLVDVAMIWGNCSVILAGKDFIMKCNLQFRYVEIGIGFEI